jgi:hypothetical protein
LTLTFPYDAIVGLSMQQKNTLVPKPLAAEPEADLPNPELNPLVNPIMGRHLGRWAEVYFTTVPEEREAALYKLLQDLEEEEGEHGATMEVDAPAAVSPAYALICARCERTNVRPQKYCGLCGALMPVIGEAAMQAAAAGASASTDMNQAAQPQSTQISEVVAPAGGSLSVALSAPDGIESAEANHRGQASLLFQEDRATASSNEGRIHVPQPVDVEWLRQQKLAADEPEESSLPTMRLAVIMAALCLAVLLYLHWRDNRSESISSAPAHEAQVAPAAKQAPGPDQLPETTAERGPAKQTPRDQPSQQPASVPHIVPTSTIPNTAKPKPAGRDLPASAASAISDVASGELGAAMWLMSDKNPKRNSKEAAKLLWKAVGKDDSNALLPLSDLYARGDGVPRNCAQAQLLLKAAAQRGVPSAQDKLAQISSSCR